MTITYEILNNAVKNNEQLDDFFGYVGDLNPFERHEFLNKPEVLNYINKTEMFALSDAITFEQLLSYDLPLTHQAIKDCEEDCKNVSYHDRVFENKTAGDEWAAMCIYANAFETLSNKLMPDCKKRASKPIRDLINHIDSNCNTDDLNRWMYFNLKNNADKFVEAYNKA